MTYNTEGIILRYRDVGEHDRIYTVLSAEHGKIDGWAQGIRKPKSKLVAHLQPLYFCDFMFARGRRFDRIAQVRVLNRWPELWADFQKLAQAMYVASLVDQVLRPGTKERAVFGLLQDVLNVISDDGHNAPSPGLRPPSPAGRGTIGDSSSAGRGEGEGILTTFSLKLLRETGFSPELRQCVICKSEVAGLSRYFDAVRGGVMCYDCVLKIGENAFQISALTLDTLETMLASPSAHLEMPDVISRELTQIANAMMSAHFGEPPRSRTFMDYIARDLPQMSMV